MNFTNFEQNTIEFCPLGKLPSTKIQDTQLKIASNKFHAGPHFPYRHHIHRSIYRIRTS
jgi:hypothetical protein